MISSDKALAAPRAKNLSTIPVERIDARIYLLRGQKVLLDRDLAELYGVETRALNQTVKRNADRFPDDFMFALTREEILNLSQTVISSRMKHAPKVWAFTEQGVAMLSGLLNSSRAVQVNIEIMRAFVRMRQMLTEHAELGRKLKALEKKYDAQFKVVFEAISELMEPVDEDDAAKEIGFHTILKPAPSKK